MKLFGIFCLTVFFFSCISISYEQGRTRGEKDLLEFYGQCYDAVNAADPNAWAIDWPDNPILSICDDTIRLQPGSSIRFIEVGDPNVEISRFEPNMLVTLAIECNLPSVLIAYCNFVVPQLPAVIEPGMAVCIDNIADVNE